MIVVMDLAGQPRFYVGAAMGLDIDRIVGLAINKVVSTEMDVVIGFFELSL